MDDIISVIIPIFNTEKYLSRCLDSIINQTYHNLDIICIDDGSSDNSLKVCQHYKEKDNRIQVFHQDNSGQSSARNMGLKYAKGKYVYFCDSDDYLEHDALFLLHRETSFDSDLTIMGFFYHDEFGTIHKRNIDEKVIKCKTVNEKISILFDLSHGYFGPTIWNKLFKKSIIDKYNLNFCDSPIAEDTTFILMYILATEKNISQLNYCGYHYLRNNGSTIARVSKNENMQYFLMLGSKLASFIKSTNVPDIYIPYMYFKFIANELLRISNRSGYVYAKKQLHKMDSYKNEAKNYLREYISYKNEMDLKNHKYDVEEGAAFCKFFLGGSFILLRIRLKYLNWRYRGI